MPGTGPVAPVKPKKKITIPTWLQNIGNALTKPAAPAAPPRGSRGYGASGAPTQPQVPAWLKNIGNTITNSYAQAGPARGVGANTQQAQAPRGPLGQTGVRNNTPYSPSLPTGTFFSGGGIASGQRQVRTGENTGMLIGGGDRGTYRVAKGQVMPTTPLVESPPDNGGGGYRRRRGGGSNQTAWPEEQKALYANLLNWNFKG